VGFLLAFVLASRVVASTVRCRQVIGNSAAACWLTGRRSWAWLIASYSPSISPLADSASDYM